MKSLKHKHRIKPGYAGGDYTPENVIEVSVTQHAMWHFANWQLWGREEDRIAWKGLSGIVGREETVREATRLGSKKSVVIMAAHPNSEEGRVKGGIAAAKFLNEHPNTLKNQVDQGRKNYEKTSYLTPKLTPKR